MGLLSLFKRRTEAASNAVDSGAPSDAVQQARTRARQRLIGAVVLVVIGVVGFPLVFETQPRPVPVDLPIELARKDGAPAVLDIPARTRATPPAVAAAPRDDVITESAADAGREVGAKPAAPDGSASHAAPKASAGAAKAVAKAADKADEKVAERVAEKPADKPVEKAAEKSADKRAEKAADKPAAEAVKKPDAATDAARAKALLDAEPAAAGGAARFIVQVGAFAEVTAARETRQKVEKLGLKTYTQVAQTAGGSRIRVRVGPFASRDEADKAVAKARAAGIAAVVLTL